MAPFNDPASLQNFRLGASQGSSAENFLAESAEAVPSFFFAFLHGLARGLRRRRMNRAVIALGSNIDPQGNIGRARELLAAACHVLAESRFVTTRPIGKTDQADFVNGAVLLETPLALDALKKTLKKIEAQLGRHENKVRFGPRTIDLDIVVWNGKIIDHDFYTRDYLKKSVLALWPKLKFQKSSRQSQS